MDQKGSFWSPLGLWKERDRYRFGRFIVARPRFWTQCRRSRRSGTLLSTLFRHKVVPFLGVMLIEVLPRSIVIVVLSSTLVAIVFPFDGCLSVKKLLLSVVAIEYRRCVTGLFIVCERGKKETSGRPVHIKQGTWNPL
jgi:hypothetical protein